jgi:predicted XRE-type DNA-binding protein
MRKNKIKTLEKAGWKVSDVTEFLELTKEESTIIDMKISLAKKFQILRKKANLSQVETAKALQTSQSRIAKMESGDASVSIDLLVRGLVNLGASKKIVGQTLVYA